MVNQNLALVLFLLMSVPVKCTFLSVITSLIYQTVIHWFQKILATSVKMLLTKHVRFQMTLMLD